MCFPLKMENRVIGVLNLSHSQPGFFTVEAEKTMELVAERCSFMIHARLQSELLKESEEYYRLITENAA
ncbi:MAG: GAF domain-containing protein, partial [Desulfuromonadales bacterium]|nr:GAF domain-containing protein [Desulfuromonadales bacterium]NIS42412.1 GAF domain-containing protein [Desulfuromonadales bacterium]